MTSRKPTFLRWAEEAEAKQMCEWAGLERASDRPDVGEPPLRRPPRRPSLLRRLQGLFEKHNAQIARDG